jgi:tryptophan synthase beta chain
MTTMTADDRAIFGRRDPDARGYFGAYGGRFVPETLVAPIEELTTGYLAARADAAFRAELDGLLQHYVVRRRCTRRRDSRRSRPAACGSS